MVLPLVDEEKPKCILCHKSFEDLDKLRIHHKTAHEEFFNFHEKTAKRNPAPGDVTVF